MTGLRRRRAGEREVRTHATSTPLVGYCQTVLGAHRRRAASLSRAVRDLTCGVESGTSMGRAVGFSGVRAMHERGGGARVAWDLFFKRTVQWGEGEGG